MRQLPWANWNGVAMPLADVRVSVLDRGFLFGDGIYEVLRVYGGRPFLLREHMARLRRSLAEIRIAADAARLEQRMHETLRESSVDSGMIYLQVTRRRLPRAGFPNPPVTPNELIYVDAIDGDPYGAFRDGAKLLTVPDVRWRRCDIKSVNLLANCLAAQAAAEAGCLEALLVAADGSVTEGSHTSLFAVQGGRILATPLGPQILPGITRGLMVKLAARAGIEIVDRSVKHADLATIDEMFLTGTTSEVLPVTQVDGKPIGNGQPGPLTQKLVTTYNDYVRDWLAGRAE
ncbi:MAG: aminotransferase class IV [Planctomycetaceae bacterium]